jgi:2'-5' RNA ligase
MHAKIWDFSNFSGMLNGMRLFIAINFSEKIKQNIFEVQDRIRKNAERGRYSLPGNFHLTLVFLGETAEDRLPEITSAIKQAVLLEEKPVSSFNLVFSRTEFFKRGCKELWFLGIDKENQNGEAQLKKLQSKLASELIVRNFAMDKRPFTAHITLGREIINGPWPFKISPITIEVNRLSLMLSEHIKENGSKSKLVYTEIFGCDLL